jgi:hypothetical protein
VKTRYQQMNRNRRGIQRGGMTLVAVVAVLWPYMFSTAATETTFTLTNRTRYYLHAKVNNESFVYIAPGGSAIAEVTAPTSVFASVQYSPGQGVAGAAERTVNVEATSTSSSGSSTCSNSSSGSTCSSTEPNVTTSATPGRWDVLPTDLTTK